MGNNHSDGRLCIYALILSHSSHNFLGKIYRDHLLSYSPYDLILSYDCIRPVDFYSKNVSYSVYVHISNDQSY